MAFDYSKLKGRIVEKYGSRTEFAKAMNVSEQTISRKINGKIPWKQPEICKAIEVLGLEESDIQDYFFVQKVQRV